MQNYRTEGQHAFFKKVGSGKGKKNEAEAWFSLGLSLHEVAK